MLRTLRPAIALIVLFTALTGLAIPLLLVKGAGKVLSYQAGGSLIEKDGKVIGSDLLGQNFTADKYFWPRPSATTDTNPNDPTQQLPAPYNAASSSASNLGASQRALIDRVKADIDKLGNAPVPAPVPADAVTTSASGLDPHITPANAARQVGRIAKARGVPEAKVRELLDRMTRGRALGVIGEPRVNVLETNLALDAELPAAAASTAPTAKRAP
jgi:K+-transporting ATPase ATPase C chain